MIGKKAERVLNRAVGYAVEQNHEYFTLEHVFRSLLEEPLIKSTVTACGADPIALSNELDAYLRREIPKKENAQAEGHPVPTIGIQRLIQRALFHVQSAGKDEIQPVDLFVALFQAKDSFALHLLTRFSIARLDVLNFISHGARREGPDAPDAPDASEADDVAGAGPESEASEPASPNPKNALEQFTVNLNQRAEAGKIDPLIGREREVERMIQTLCRRRKNNPLLVGEAGVGKTALAEGLALAIVQGKVPEAISTFVLYALDMGSVVAGTKFRGDFEARLKRILALLEERKKTGETPVLVIDEIHTIVGAGSVSGGSMDAANLLKPLLARGEIRCIGSTTFQEYRASIEKDAALARRFQKIDVPEPTQTEALAILNGIAPVLAAHHHVEYTPGALRAAVELSAKHLTDRFLPDKAIDVLDEAGAKARLKSPSGSMSAAGATVAAVIDEDAIESVIAQIARIPERTVSVSQKERLSTLERDLKLAIFGQDEAIEHVVTAIRLARSGLRTGDRPVGSFLFCGPTGVGKTELSKQLAHALGISFVRFDMSEYGERHTVSRLIGAPPGYVGFEQAGQLTEAVIKQPHAVVLLDEIEKAHPDVWNILLQVMDHGRLTDASGRKADFRNTVIILTSNVGSRDLEKRPLGLTHDSAPSSRAQKAVENAFPPEFRNRLDSIVFFNPLAPLTLAQVVGKLIVELESQLLAKNVEIEFTPQAREWLGEKGYDRWMGARPLGRLIQDKVKKPLANEILFGKLEHGGSVKVDVNLEAKPSELTFEITSNPPPKIEIPSPARATATESS